VLAVLSILVGGVDGLRLMAVGVVTATERPKRRHAAALQMAYGSRGAACQSVRD